MASASEKATPLFPEASLSASATAGGEVWTSADDNEPTPQLKKAAPLKPIVDESSAATNPTSTAKGIFVYLI